MCDRCQGAAVTRLVGLNLFLSCASRRFIYETAIDSNSSAVSAVTVFRLVDNLRPLPCIASLRLFTDLITISLKFQNVTLV